MALADNKAYLAGKFDAIQAAYERHDHAGIMAVVDSIDADGHPQVAAAIRDNLAEQRRSWTPEQRRAAGDDDADGM